MLTYMGVSEAAMKGAGTMGFATLGNVILTPVHLAIFPLLLPLVINQKNRLGQSIEIMQNMYDKDKKTKDK